MADSTVTIWHFEDGIIEPVRKLFNSVSLNSTNRIAKNGIKQKGFYEGNSLDARIFTREDIGIVPGDYICEGEQYSLYPDREQGKKIVEVRDNRRGVNPHWRIICGG